MTADELEVVRAPSILGDLEAVIERRLRMLAPLERLALERASASAAARALYGDRYVEVLEASGSLVTTLDGLARHRRRVEPASVIYRHGARG